MSESADWKCHVFCDYADLKAAEAKVAEQAATIDARTRMLDELNFIQHAQAATINRLESVLRFVQSCAVQCPACKQYVDAALNEQEKP